MIPRRRELLMSPAPTTPFTSTTLRIRRPDSSLKAAPAPLNSISPPTPHQCSCRPTRRPPGVQAAAAGVWAVNVQRQGLAACPSPLICGCCCPSSVGRRRTRCPPTGLLLLAAGCPWQCAVQQQQSKSVSVAVARSPGLPRAAAAWPHRHTRRADTLPCCRMCMQPRSRAAGCAQ